VALANWRAANSTEKLKALESKAHDAAMRIIKRAGRTAGGIGGRGLNKWLERERQFRWAADVCASQISILTRAIFLPRWKFSSQLSEYLHSCIGKWCDSEVAALTEIAYPGKEVTIDMVRKARKGIL